MIITDEESAAWFEQGSDDSCPLGDIGQPTQDTDRGVHQIEVSGYCLASVVHVRVNELDVSARAFGNVARMGKRGLGQIEANDARGPATRKPDRVGSDVALQVDDFFAGEIAESFDILGEFGAYGRRVLEKALVVAVVASHVQLGSVVPVALVIGKPLRSPACFSHVVIVRRWGVGKLRLPRPWQGLGVALEHQISKGTSVWAVLCSIEACAEDGRDPYK